MVNIQYLFYTLGIIFLFATLSYFSYQYLFSLSDWVKTIISLLEDKLIKTGVAVPKFFVAGLMLAYGLMIIVLGVRGHKLVEKIGRIREVTYFTIMLTPIFYGVVEPSFFTILSIVVFLPIFYGVVELANRILPNPKTYAMEEKVEPLKPFSGNFPSELPKPVQLVRQPPQQPPTDYSEYGYYDTSIYPPQN